MRDGMSRVHYQSSLHPMNRLRRLVQMLLAALSMLLWTLPLHAQPAPDPRPEAIPFYYDPAPVFDEGQRKTIARDAELVQSSQIPTLLYVRPATVDEAAPDAATAFATDVRETWRVESSDGADDGLVLLYSHVEGNPGASTIVASWGEATFEGSGLTPAYVENLLAKNPRTLLDDGHPFEAVVYALRELRYGGIYLPPPPAPVEGARSVAQAIANVAGPLMVVATVAASVMISLRGQQRTFFRHPWRTGTAITGTLVALAMVSVYGQSPIGIASIAILVVVIALRIRASTRPADGTRCRSVPPTVRRMRRRVQLRRRHHLIGATS